MTVRKGLALGALAVVVAAWAVWLRPVALGGDNSYVVVQGSSMEPTYRNGDLVVVQRHETYSPGEVVSFRIGGRYDDQNLVIHRIVGGDGVDGYVTQGDNRDQTDPWQPTDENVLGAARWHVPFVGHVMSRVANPAVLAVLGGLLAFGGARKVSKSRRRRRIEQSLAHWDLSVVSDQRKVEETEVSDSEHDAPDAPDTENAVVPGVDDPRPPLWQRARVPGPQWAVIGAAVCVVVLAIALPLAMSAMRAPDTRVAVVDTGSYSYRLDLDYEATAPKSAVYPSGKVGSVHNETGVIAPDGPLYGEVLETLTLTYDAAADAEGEAAEAFGAIFSADVEVSTPEGWTQSLDRVEPVSVVRGKTIEIPIDLVDVARRVEEISVLTGVANTGHTITITPRVEVIAESPQGLVDAEYGEPVEFEIHGAVMTQSPVRALSGTEPVQSRVTEPKSFRVGFVDMDTTAARAIFGGLALVAAAALAVLVMVIVTGAGLPPADRIAARYRGVIVDVSEAAAPPGPHVLVSSIEELVKIAKSEQTVILHESLGSGAHRYRVFLGAVTYEYDTMPDDGAFAQTTGVEG